MQVSIVGEDEAPAHHPVSVLLRKVGMMSEAGSADERGPHNDGLKKVATALHDLCQPLTTLQCRLEMAGLIGTPEAYREAVDLGLAECARLVDAVASMREAMRGAIREAGPSGSAQ